MHPDLQALEGQIGHTFQDESLLVRALTHKSVCTGRKTESTLLFDNEQFEFLGDSILGFIVSEALLQRYPQSPEGRLSKLKAHLVSAAHLFKAAQGLNLGHYLHLGRGEEMSGGRHKRALLADAMEAIIAAVYLDGGIEIARRFVIDRLVNAFPTVDGGEGGITDYKTALQERVQVLSLPQPRYHIVEESGPEHAKTFVMEVKVGPALASRGEGSSKKAAGQSAAKGLLDTLEERASLSQSLLASSPPA